MPISSQVLTLFSTYNFTTLAPALLGFGFENVKLISLMDYEQALRIDNVDVKYRTIYPSLPQGTLNDPRANIYYLFKTDSGDEIILAEQWIDMSTVVEVSTINFKITITDSTTEDMNTVRNVLNSIGITSYVIEVI